MATDATRRILFSDEQGHELVWSGSDPHEAYDAFEGFLREHRSEENTDFSIEDEAADEALLLAYAAGVIGRVRGVSHEEPEVEYRLATNRGDYATDATNFLARGHAGLFYGRWLPDIASVVRAQIRAEVDESWLRRTHPRELRRRLAVLTCVDGGEPTSVDGVTHYGFGNGLGDTVNAWFVRDGRGVVTVLDHESELGVHDDPHAQAALYDGLPPDLLALVRGVPASATVETVAHPDGGTVVAASGVFHLSAPCAASEGLVARLQEAGLGLDATGVDFLLEPFLAMEDFTAAGVTAAAGLWSAEEISAGFDRAAPWLPEPPTGPLDERLTTRFYEIWADNGYVDRWGTHYVLFDSDRVEDAGPARDEALDLLPRLGLERVDAPRDAADGEVWVLADPRFDDGFEAWA